MQRVYNSKDATDKASSEARRLTKVLLQGTEQEIESLQIVDESVIRSLRKELPYIENGAKESNMLFYCSCKPCLVTSYSYT